MASSGRRVSPLRGVLGVAAAMVLASCDTSSHTRNAVNIARDELGRIPAASLGHVLGHGSFGSAGVSGSRPTAFIAVQTEVPTVALMATVGDRMRQAGFSPFVTCRPPLPCTWDRRVNRTLITASAVVKTGGEPWGEKSTAHGTVAAGSRVLQVEMVVGG